MRQVWSFWTTTICLALFGIATSLPTGNLLLAQEEISLPELEPPRQTAPPSGQALGDAEDLIGYREAMTQFKDATGNPLTGLGLTVAVIDTGLVKEHRDFEQVRIARMFNLTGDNAANRDDATDGNGHGTHVAGIIGADGIHSGMAADARFVVIKALHDTEPQPAFAMDVNQRLLESLKWILEQAGSTQISAVNVSISDPVLRINDNFGSGVKKDIRKAIQDLRARRIPVVVAAGNHFRSMNSAERLKPLQAGMGFPAIIQETISVGAVYEAEQRSGHQHTPQGYLGAMSHSIAKHQITPFSARLPEGIGGPRRTDILAPGGLLMASTGITTDGSSHYEHGGTSQAAPVVTAAILLLQQFYKSFTGELPVVDDLERWLRVGGKEVLDGDDEYDNVRHSCEKFYVLNVNGALINAQQQIRSFEP